MASEGKGVLVKADPIANTFREEIKSALAAAPRPPKLVGILATAAAPSRFYAEFTKKQCDALGVEFVLRTVGAAADETLAPGEGVEEAIIEANEDDGVDGIMVYYPIFGVQQDHYLQQIVSPYKDVEGLNFKFHYNLYHKSEVVGRPLAALLANDGARVFSVDIDSIQEYTKRPRQSAEQRKYHPRHVVHPSTLSLSECLALSDVVVSAVPSAAYKVKTSALKDGCVCLNVAADKNFETDVREKASLYLPTIGKVTIMMLLRNL
ncbi:Methylenetetrahydrofolate dehydrogenase [NAD(+)] [Trametes pubescens]|uniref:Methylenetetrahydrofolate dehydrogenase [NAD(+)] n=1 Tax=Trametes pubescens TaxID=154538 RepID=A0A1M2VUU9_TRAPU|nr:Methylenetetrahydrofolate dehydrogenase [NAD(+)] [Trametes pubescens]